MKWLKSHVPEDGSVFLSDVTSLYTALNVIGPKAKYLLAELSDENFNDFARMTCRVSLTLEYIFQFRILIFFFVY
jgi:pyruvate dehydrogenase phosphatase regulatory subunit